MGELDSLSFKLSTEAHGIVVVAVIVFLIGCDGEEDDDVDGAN